MVSKKIEERSLAQFVAGLSKEKRLEWLETLSEREQQALPYSWEFWARPKQLPPRGRWKIWLALAGRGFGKTRLAAEWVRSNAELGKAKRIALVGRTAADVRDVMIEGSSGILSVCPPWDMPLYESSKRRLTWKNGSIATAFTADEPSMLRGPQHDLAWCDELCFIPGTLISTKDGPIPIEEIGPGDLIHTRDGLKKIKHAGLTNKNARLYEVRFSEGRWLTGTKNHPVFVHGKGFVDLSLLKTGDLVHTRGANPDTTVVLKVNRLMVRSPVYNIEVEDKHEYYANGILVHNCSWTQSREVWDNLMLGLRLGKNPKCIVTTTPRPIQLIRELIVDSNTTVTRGSTFENSSNLAASFIEQIEDRYEGTRLGRQELHAEILEEIPGAMWTREIIEEARVSDIDYDKIERLVVGIDPAVTSHGNSSETGLMVVCRMEDDEFYVLQDASFRASPDEWAKKAIYLYKNWEADRIVAEVNQGGDMIEKVLRTVDPNVSYKAVRASRGKVARAEPISALYEQKRVHHVGVFNELEDQMVMFTHDGSFVKSPDRVDALCWAITELSMGKRGRAYSIAFNVNDGKRDQEWKV